MAVPDDPAAAARGYNLPPRSRLWRDRLLPRVVFPLFWLAWLLLIPARVLGSRARARMRTRDPVLALECGIVGWTKVEFEELIVSAGDYVGPARVRQQVIDRDLPYLPQFRTNQQRDDPTHVVLDVRTPTQTWGRGVVEAVVVAWHVLVSGRTPIVILSDFYYRRQRWHAAVLSAFSGVVVGIVEPTSVRSLFPHRRLIGPMPMPISRERLLWLEDVSRAAPHTGSRVDFIGHVYPPRSIFLEAVGERLATQGITLSVNGNKWGTSNDDYWRTLAESDIVVNTGFQGPDRPMMDHIWVVHMVYRVHEVLAAGAALVTSRVHGAERYFAPGSDFLDFESVDEAVEAIAALVTDPDLRMRITRAGHEASRRFILENVFWTSIDERLGVDAIGPIPQAAST